MVVQGVVLTRFFFPEVFRLQKFYATDVLCIDIFEDFKFKILASFFELGLGHQNLVRKDAVKF